MITVTGAMVQAYKDAWAASGCSQRAGLEAAAALMDKAIEPEVNRLVREAYERGFKDGAR